MKCAGQVWRMKGVPGSELELVALVNYSPSDRDQEEAQVWETKNSQSGYPGFIMSNQLNSGLYELVQEKDDDVIDEFLARRSKAHGDSVRERVRKLGEPVVVDGPRAKLEKEIADREGVPTCSSCGARGRVGRSGRCFNCWAKNNGATTVAIREPERFEPEVSELDLLPPA